MSGFDEVVIPPTFGYGSSGGHSFSTDVFMLKNKREQRNQNFEMEQAKFNIAYPVKKIADIIALRNFHRLRNGKARGFKILDPLDFSSNPTDPTSSTTTKDDQLIGIGDGTNHDFQLSKTITDSFNSYTYDVYKPQSGVKIAVDGTLKTLTTDYTISSTGLVHIITAPPNTKHVTAGFLHWHPVRFDTDDFIITYDEFNAFQVVSLPLIGYPPES